MSRTRTLVSTARITLPYVLSDSVFQFIEGSTSRGPLGEKRPMGILRSIPSRPPHDDLLAFIAPLQNRARADAKPPPNFCRYRNLSLRRNFGSRQCHSSILPR
jgi:hypothetical protein